MAPSRLEWNDASGASATHFYIWIDYANGDLYWKQWVPKSATATLGANRYYTLPASLPAGSYRWYIQTWEPDTYSSWSEPADVTVP